MVHLFSDKGIRVSIFVDPIIEMILGAKEVGAQRIELYTEAYASAFFADKLKAREPYVQAAFKATELGLEVNAGHDLDLNNLSFFMEGIPHLKEVSIGHALICDALYLGLENTIQMYKRCLQ